MSTYRVTAVRLSYNSLSSIQPTVQHIVAIQLNGWWERSRQDAINMIKSGDVLYTEDARGNTAIVEWYTVPASGIFSGLLMEEFIKTRPDGIRSDNLLSLPPF